MRSLGLDIGKTRIGVALSDETGTIASPFTTLDARESTLVLRKKIGEICEENDVSCIVIGLPLSMSGGDRGESARMAKAFGNGLEETMDITVVYMDERFSTTQAERALVDADVSRRRRKTVVDKVAAALILQAFLDSKDNDGD